MESVKFDYHSSRSTSARFSRKFDDTMRRLLVLAAWVLIGGGLVVLVVLHSSAGWLMTSLSAWLGMLAAWQKRELKPLPVLPSSTSIDGRLSRDVLELMPQSPSPKQIAAAVAQANSGLFFAVRFGLSANFLNNIASAQDADTAKIWANARQIAEELNLQEINGGVLILALLREFNGYETLLAQLHLSENDIVRGIRWYQHILDLIDKHGKPKRTGGLARDWSFGYIPLLQRFGQNLSEQIAHGGLITVELEAHQKIVQQMIDTFATRGRQNVALVGAQGAGKSTIVQVFAEKLLDADSNLPSSLKFRQIFVLDASALISAAPGRGELEGLINQVLGEAYSAKNIIVCLDNAELFFSEGVGSVDLSNVLLPIIEAGNLRMILTMDEQKLLQISQRNPALVNALNRLTVTPATKDETISVMQDQLIVTEFNRQVTYTYQSLEEAYRLSERYVFDLAQPGRSLKLLESAASYAESGLVTMNSVDQAIEQTTGVKVAVASQADERQTLLNLEDLIHKRMVNQSRAVAVVSDALRRARAGVRNESRPIGTFLFLGPTGVGKTELSKALADVYFGGEECLIRVDLNEFVRPEDVARLIADGAQDPTSLTAQIMKQPFSVVLLDEIEKAAPAVLTTLLQVLDEGILRDIRGREVSFRDAIIIATSNAGADRIREYIERGYQLEQFEKPFLDELISSGQFRPEFLNRFDEIAIFRPFTKEELVQVVDLIIAGVNKTLAPQKITVIVEPDAKKLLVDHGYDPRLGARPMRRVVQKAVENTVAKKMLSGELSTGGSITITLDQVTASLGGEEPRQVFSTMVPPPQNQMPAQTQTPLQNQPTEPPIQQSDQTPPTLPPIS